MVEVGVARELLEVGVARELQPLERRAAAGVSSVDEIVADVVGREGGGSRSHVDGDKEEVLHHADDVGGHAQVHVGAVHVEDGGTWWVLDRERYLDGLPIPRAVCGGGSVAVAAGDGYSTEEDPVGTAIQWMEPTYIDTGVRFGSRIRSHTLGG